MGSSQSIPAQSQIERDDAPVNGGCPMHRGLTDASSNAPGSSATTTLNDRNNIPDLAQTAAPGQRIALPLERTRSSIPRTELAAPSSSHEAASACPMAAPQDKKETWVYPSPQQFYNALVRKGWETPEEAVPVMVDIHNWMNEAVWQEVLRWESRYFHPQATANSSSMKLADATESPALPEVSLAKFQGRPQDLSPKARFHLLLGRMFPNVYSNQGPFDRHDWMIRRESLGPEEQEKLHRYVIDYYSGVEDEEGNPVFHFDVRPAIDDLDSLAVRLREWARVKQETWFSSSTNVTGNTKIEN